MEGSTLSDTEPYAMQQAKLLDLGGNTLFQNIQGSRLSRHCHDLVDRMFQTAAALASPHYQSRMGELTLQTSQLRKAIVLFKKIACPYENLATGIDLNFGRGGSGRVHAAFPSRGLIYAMDWLLIYSIALLGDKDCFQCVHIGSSLNLSSWHAMILDKRFKWVGIEEDEHTCYLASQIAIEALPQLTKLLGRQIPIGMMQGDPTSHFNLKGTDIVFVCDHGLLDTTVFSTYESMWLGYQHPLILVQSIMHWKSRSFYLGNYFNHIQVCGVSKPLSVHGNGSTDSLVLAFVASPKDSPNIPPLLDNTPSLYGEFKNTAASLEKHRQLNCRMLNQFQTAKRKRKRNAASTKADKTNMSQQASLQPLMECSSEYGHLADEEGPPTADEVPK